MQIVSMAVKYLKLKLLMYLKSEQYLQLKHLAVSTGIAVSKVSFLRI